MSQLVNHIEELLENHDFVTIPGFGGFVAETRGAVETNGMICPPCKIMAFNPALTYNDGLLAHEYVRKNGIGYEKANLIIAESVNEINRELMRGQQVKFGSLGTFTLSGGNILFEMSDKGGFLTSSYGLDEIYFPEIKTGKPSATDIHSNTDKQVSNANISEPLIKVSTNIGRTANIRQVESGFSKIVGLAAAVLLLIMLFPVRIEEGNISNYASFVPPVINANVSEKAPDCTPYHMIIASFNTNFRAEKFISALPGELKDRSRIIYSENRFRIALESFASEEAGEAYIAQFISEYPEYYDAWILNYNP